MSYSTYVQMMVILLDTTQSHKEWWSGAQLRPLVLCLSVTSHSCSEEPGPHHLHLSALFSSSDYVYSGLRIASYCTLERRRRWHPLQCSCLESPRDGGAWWAAVHGVAWGWTRLSDFTFTFHFHALEGEMATHSSVLAWRVPGRGEPGGLPSLGSHRVRHD